MSFICSWTYKHRMFGLNMNLAMMCSDSFSPYFESLLLSGSCFPSMPWMPTPLPQGLWYCIKPCIYSFLILNCGPTSCSTCIHLPCLGANHRFCLDPGVVSAMDLAVYFENTDFPEWHPLPITEPQWKVLSWLQFFILGTRSKFQGFF